MINQEYGVRATFPEGAWVCRGESGSHPHGFYAGIDGGRFECPPRGGDGPRGTYGVWADYNAAFYRTLEQAAPCRNGRTDAVRAPDGRVLAFKGLRTRTCLSGAPGDPVSLWITAFAGEGPASSDPEADGAPAFLYHAYLSTSATNLEADTVVFQRFLDQLVLAPPGK